MSKKPQDWKDAIGEWRALSEEEKLRRSWDSIPLSVARSMAFEGQPIDLEWLKTIHARRPMPVVRSRPLPLEDRSLDEPEI